jgi:hypothetical protein
MNTDEHRAEPNYDAEMQLPAGMTCDNCRHAQRCFGIGYSQPGRTSCDFWPNKFSLKLIVEAEENLLLTTEVAR